jgi:hypothetical protein
VADISATPAAATIHAARVPSASASATTIHAAGVPTAPASAATIHAARVSSASAPARIPVMVVGVDLGRERGQHAKDRQDP